RWPRSRFGAAMLKQQALARLVSQEMTIASRRSSLPWCRAEGAGAILSRSRKDRLQVPRRDVGAPQ
ncbi:hypothetical protein, partial [Klebsiella pneumoniae]|uniref:hypothetical protein n=1 Tax=Klebsiella pneumoniae TaxID=573 RepID=UPI00371ADE43